MGATALTPASRRRAAFGVAAGLGALLALRLLLIHNALGETLYWEEPYRLTIATEILAGPRLPVVEYQADHYQGGSLAVGLLAVPFVATLGASFETLKLVPLSFTLATAILWCVLLWRAVGPRAAVIDAWLLALAPPFAQVYQVHAMGSHAESALFTAAGFLLLREIVASPRRSVVLPVALGAVGGLGLWFCYTAASGIAAWGLVYLWIALRDRRPRLLLPLALGVAAGLLPWLAYNAYNGFRGLDRLTELLDRSRPVVTGSEEALPTRAAALFAVDLPRSLGFPERVIGVPEASAWIYLGLVGACLAGAAWLAFAARPGPRSDPAARSGAALVSVLLVLAVVLHLVVYAVSSFRPDVETGYIAYRFFAPLFPLMSAAVAIAVAQSWAGRSGVRREAPLSPHGAQPWAGRLRPLASAALAVLLVLGAYGTVSLLREHPAKPSVPPQNGYRLLGLLTAIKHRDRVAHAASLLEQLGGEERRLAFFGYGWGLAFDYEKFGDWPAFLGGLALCRSASDREAAMDGVRWSLGARLQSMRQQANAGFRAEWNRRALLRMSEFAARVRELPAAEPARKAIELHARRER